MYQHRKSEILEICLNLVFSEEETIETALAHYPDYANELRPQLEAAVWIYKRKDVTKLRPGYLATSKKRFVENIKLEKQLPNRSKIPFFGWGIPTYRIALVVFIFVLTVLSFQLSAQKIQTALPGDQLYSWKLASEDLRLLWISDPAKEAKLYIEFAVTRAKEIEILLEKDQFENVPAAFENYHENLEIASEIISSLQGNTQEEISLAKNLASVISEHNQTFRKLIATASIFDLPGNITSLFGISVEINDEINQNMMVLVEELGERIAPTPPIVFQLNTPTPTPTTPLTKKSAPTTTPESTEILELRETSDPSETPEPSKTPEPSETLEPSETPEPPDDVDDKITPTKKPTKTPKLKKPTKTPKK